MLSCSNKHEVKVLTLEKVIELSSKENLSWEDFKKYEGKEIGSGLYIIEYVINKKYSVLVGGGDLAAPPFYINLVNRTTDESIDIRYNNVVDFLNKTH